MLQHNIQALGHAYLNRAREYVQQAHNNIDDVINARRQAMDAGASNLLPNDFSKADESLKFPVSQASLKAANFNLK